MLGLMCRYAVRGAAAVVLVLATGFGLPACGDVRNETTGAGFDGLAAALAAAAAGDTLTVDGTYSGEFIIDTPLTLRGAGAVLDAGGSGTALVIAADDVTLEGLTLTGSGRAAGPLAIWGEAGLRVEGDRARLIGITVSGNDWGVLLLDVDDAVLTSSAITDNARHGVLVMGGAGHRITLNTVNGNEAGIGIDPFYGDETELIIPEAGDQAAMERANAMKDNAQPAHDIVVAQNEVVGNGSIGIVIGWKAHHIDVLDNVVARTGRDRAPDEAQMQAFAAALGGALEGDISAVIALTRSEVGAGIVLSCLPEDNRVIGNESRDNLSYGIGLNVTDRNEVADNDVTGNRIGINLSAADDNRITGNRVSGNTDYGIRVDTYYRFDAVPSGSTGNLFARNTLTENGVNAYDSSDRVPSYEEADARLDALPWPDEAKEQFLSNPSMRRMVLESQFAHHKPGHNRWDDGALGNHYGEFDEAAEGFVDEDGDGIGEAPHPIPGGGHVDHFPLTAAWVAQAPAVQ